MNLSEGASLVGHLAIMLFTTMWKIVVESFYPRHHHHHHLVNDEEEEEEVEDATEGQEVVNDNDKEESSLLNDPLLVDRNHSDLSEDSQHAAERQTTQDDRVYDEDADDENSSSRFPKASSDALQGQKAFRVARDTEGKVDFTKPRNKNPFGTVNKTATASNSDSSKTADTSTTGGTAAAASQAETSSDDGGMPETRPSSGTLRNPKGHTTPAFLPSSKDKDEDHAEPTGSNSSPTPAGTAAASMLINSGDTTYAGMMDGTSSATSSAVARNIAVPKLEQLPAMVAGVMGNDPAVQTKCTMQFRRALSVEKNPPIQQVIDTRVVPRFVEFLQRDDNPALQLEAAWVLTNIASGTSEHTKVVVEVGVVPIFVRLLLSPNDDVREQAVWALGNIAGDSSPCRDLVLQAGAMQPLLMQLHQNSNLSMVRNATWTLSNFCRGKPQPDFELVRPALPTLAQLIFLPDEEVLMAACWALSDLSDGPNEKIQAVLEAGVCRRLVELLLNPSPKVQAPALQTVGNIVSGNDLQTQVVINNNALPCLLALLLSPKKGIRKEACWALSNITLGNEEQIQAVINNGIIPPLIQLLTNAEFDIRKEAAWAISNATSGGNAQQIKFLVQQGCIRPLCDLLMVSDPKIVTIALEGLENILRVGEEDARVSQQKNQMAVFISEAEGLTKIEDLQQHSNHGIYERCIEILDSYFGVEDEEELAAIARNGRPSVQ